MNAKEVIRTLKSNAGVNNHAAIMLMAADLIESLQAQLTERDDRIKWLQRELTSLAIESIDRVRELAKLEAEVIAMREAQRLKGCRLSL
jgi:hypothetical protein